MQDSKKKYGIVFVTPLPPPEGGIATLSHILLRRGLVAPFECFCVNTSVIGRHFSDDCYNVKDELLRSIGIVVKLIRLLCRRQIVLVHLNSSLASNGIMRDWLVGILTRLMGKSLVVNYHGDILAFTERVGGFRRCVLKSLANMASINLVLTQKSQDFLQSLIGQGHVNKLPNFIEIDTPDLPQKENKYSGMQVVFVGRLSKAKGIDIVLQVARGVPDVQFCLVGHEVNDAKNEIDVLRSLDNVHIAGLLPNSEVRALLEQSDVFFLPSEHEGFPISIIEAMVAGMPVVASDVGAIGEIVEQGRGGFVCAPKDADGFISALSKLRDDTSLCQTMGQFNHRKVLSEYEYGVVIRSLCNLYQQVLSL